jgi:hypothetical protein
VLEEILAQAVRVEALELVPVHLEDMGVEEVRDLEADQVFMVAEEEAILRLRVLALADLEEEEEAVVMDSPEDQAASEEEEAQVQVGEETVQEELAARMQRQR